jgi:hypothetical protein
MTQVQLLLWRLLTHVHTCKFILSYLNNNNNNIQNSNHKKHKQHKPWWKFSDKLEEKWKIMKKAYHKYLHNRSQLMYKIRYIMSYKEFRKEKASSIQKWLKTRNEQIEEKIKNTINVNWKQWKKITKTSHRKPILIHNNNGSIPLNNVQSTNNLASTFSNIFIKHNTNTEPSHENNVHQLVTDNNVINSSNDLLDKRIDINDIIDRCKSCNDKTSTGPDCIPAKLIKAAKYNFHCALFIIFNYSWNAGVIPQDWKDSIIIPIYKNGDKNNGKSYRPISVTSVVVRIFERVLYKRYFNIVIDKINNLQAGFRKIYLL